MYLAVLPDDWRRLDDGSPVLFKRNCLEMHLFSKYRFSLKCCTKTNKNLRLFNINFHIANKRKSFSRTTKPFSWRTLAKLQVRTYTITVVSGLDVLKLLIDRFLMFQVRYIQIFKLCFGIIVVFLFDFEDLFVRLLIKSVDVALSLIKCAR